MPKQVPQIVKRFCNLLWANLPSYYIIKFLFHRNILFVTITIKSDDDVKQLRRQYSRTIMASHKNLWGLVEDCSSEIQNSVNKPTG